MYAQQLAPSAVSISVTKDGIRFSTTGDIGSANVTIRQNNGVDVKVGHHSSHRTTDRTLHFRDVPVSVGRGANNH